MSNSSVRLAFETSVAWTRPPVSRQMRNVSTVPKASSPRSARAAQARRPVEDLGDLRPAEVGVDRAGRSVPGRAPRGRPPAARRSAAPSPGSARRSRSRPADRSPAPRRSSSRAGSSMPMAAIDGRIGPDSARTRRAVPSWVDQIASGSCSTSPGAGKIWGSSSEADARIPPACVDEDRPRRRRALVEREDQRAAAMATATDHGADRHAVERLGRPAATAAIPRGRHPAGGTSYSRWADAR